MSEKSGLTGFWMQDDFFEIGSTLSPKQEGDFYRAVVRFMQLNEEPNIPLKAAKCFKSIRTRLEKSKAYALNRQGKTSNKTGIKSGNEINNESYNEKYNETNNVSIKERDKRLTFSKSPYLNALPNLQQRHGGNPLEGVSPALPVTDSQTNLMSLDDRIERGECDLKLLQEGGHLSNRDGSDTTIDQVEEWLAELIAERDGADGKAASS